MHGGSWMQTLHVVGVNGRIICLISLFKGIYAGMRFLSALVVGKPVTWLLQEAGNCTWTCRS